VKRVVVILGLSTFLAGQVFGGLVTNVSVTNFTWTGSVNGNWANAGNWVANLPTNNTPTATAPNSAQGLNSVTFVGNASHRTISLGNSLWNVRGMEFDSAPSSGGFTFNSGTSPGAAFGFSLRPDGIVNFDSHNQTFNVPIKLNSYGGGALDLTTRTTINAASGGFDFTGNWSGAPTHPTFDLNGGLLAFTGPGDITIGTATTAGLISSSTAAGGLEFDGPGTVSLNGTLANTFSGEVIINGGTVNANKVNALGNNAPLIIRNNGVLQVGANNQSLGAGSAFIGGTVLGTTAILQMSGSNNIQSGFGGAIFGGTGGFTKTGAGTYEFSQANTFTGGLSINNGKVKLSNTLGSGTGSGAVVINNGGTLSGKGISSGPLTLNSGGTINPGDPSNGNPLGMLTTGSSTWNGGSTAVFQINSANGSPGAVNGWTAMTIVGSLTLSASSGTPIKIDLTSLTLSDSPGMVSDFSASTPYDWLFASATGGITGFDPSEFVVDTTHFANDTHGGLFSVQVENGGHELHVTYIPEPSSIALAVLGGFGLIFTFKIRRALK